MIDSILRIVEFLQSQQKIILFMKCLLTIPIALIIYYSLNGVIVLNDLDFQKAIEFVLSFQVIIPILMYFFAFFLSYKVAYWIMLLLSYIFKPVCRGMVYSSFKTSKFLKSGTPHDFLKQKKFSSRKLRRAHKFIFGKSTVRKFDFSKFDKIIKSEIRWVAKLAVMLLQFIVAYSFFLSGKVIFVGWVDIVIKTLSIISIILLLQTSCLRRTQRDYPNIFKFNLHT